MQPWQKGAVVLTTVEEGRTFSGREGRGLQQTEAFTAEAQAQGHGESRNPQPSQEQREGAVQVGRGLGLNTSLHVGTWLSPHGVHLPRRRVASANDFSKETGDGQSAGQSRDAPLDAESHRHHRRGRAPSPVPEGWGVTADTAETWAWGVTTALESMSPEPTCQRAGESPQT